MARTLCALAVLLACAAAGVRAADDDVILLEGVKAQVGAPAGKWSREVKNMAAGQWRVAFRGAKAQCEARTFPVKSVEEPVRALWQVADAASRQLKGDGFGLTSEHALTLEGRQAAEADWWVNVGTAQWSGRIRLLRAAPDLWALGWGLAAADASADEQRAAEVFAGTLVPSEPGFYEPTFTDGDPEEALARPAGEPPVVRRHALALLALFEAGAHVRFPRATRAAVLEGLAREVREGTAKMREELRALAEAFAESAGQAPEARTATRETLGKRALADLAGRANGGNLAAQALGLTIAQGRTPVAGTAQDGLTRFEAEALIDGCAFLTAIAADGPFEPTQEQREVQRLALVARWAFWTPHEVTAAREAARAAADLATTWPAASAPLRFGLRAEVAAALVPVVPPAPPGTAVPAPADMKALRARLDASPIKAPALFAVCCSLSPSEHLRLLALLSPRAPR